jgi:hypothetical protein
MISDARPILRRANDIAFLNTPLRSCITIKKNKIEVKLQQKRILQWLDDVDWGRAETRSENCATSSRITANLCSSYL